MSFFSWNDKFSVGVAIIDNDHKVLVDLIDQLHEAFVNGDLDDTMASVLATLVDYTQYHFDREERMMEQAGYPSLVQHKHIHEDLRRQVEEIQDRFLSGSASGKMGTEVLAFLHDWLYFHILEEDRDYMPTMTAKF